MRPGILRFQGRPLLRGCWFLSHPLKGEIGLANRKESPFTAKLAGGRSKVLFASWRSTLKAARSNLHLFLLLLVRRGVCVRGMGTYYACREQAEL